MGCLSTALTHSASIRLPTPSLCKTFLIHSSSISGNIQRLLISTCTNVHLNICDFPSLTLSITRHLWFNIDFNNGPALLSPYICRFSGNGAYFKGIKRQCLDIGDLKDTLSLFSSFFYRVCYPVITQPIPFEVSGSSKRVSVRLWKTTPFAF